MKKSIFLLSLIITTLLLSVSALAAEKTDAFNRLMNTIVEKVDGGLPGSYMVKDNQGNIWRADFAQNGNIVCLSTQIDDYDKAHALADKLVGGNINGSYGYKIPFSRHLEEPLTNEIVVPVYKDTKVDIICARPEYLYPSCKKLINSFSLDTSKGTEIIMFYTRTTASFMAAITSGGLTADHLWGQDWFSEEEEAAMEELENSTNNRNNSIEYYQYTIPMPKYTEKQYQQDLDLYYYRKLAEAESLYGY